MLVMVHLSSLTVLYIPMRASATTPEEPNHELNGRQLPLTLQAISNASACHVSVISGKPEVHPIISQR